MSFFNRWFGAGSAEAERKDADAHFAAGRFYEARQAFERLLERRDASAADRSYAEAGIVRCQDELAAGRIAEAERLIGEGQTELARGELQTAIDTARSPAMIERARRRLDTADRRTVRQRVEVVELGDEERWALIAGNWEDAQIEEYDGYGEAFRTALLAMAKGDAATAGPLLEGIAKEHGEDAVYLWLEVARARSRLEKHDNARIALKRFLKRVPDEDRSEARVEAYAYLAQLADRNDDEEGALEHLNKAIEAMPDDPRPFVNLGAYLRAKGHAAEAIDVLDAGIGLMDEDRPAPMALQELGLARRDAGRDDEAIETLERVIRIYVARASIDDFPPSTAVPLAELHEKNGNLARAADLWAALTRTKDEANLLKYHREAARVLGLLGERREARRFLARAGALAENDPRLADSIEMQLTDLDKDE
jgi:tetratricopeptide (TPR) repeat protein